MQNNCYCFSFPSPLLSVIVAVWPVAVQAGRVGAQSHGTTGQFELVRQQITTQLSFPTGAKVISLFSLPYSSHKISRKLLGLFLRAAENGLDPRLVIAGPAGRLTPQCFEVVRLG